MLGVPHIFLEGMRYARGSCSLNRVALLIRINHIQGFSQEKRWRKKGYNPQPAAIDHHLARDYCGHQPNTR